MPARKNVFVNVGIILTLGNVLHRGAGHGLARTRFDDRPADNDSAREGDIKAFDAFARFPFNAFVERSPVIEIRRMRRTESLDAETDARVRVDSVMPLVVGLAVDARHRAESLLT